jgi:plasmid maintenance system antidote protein VapI
MMGKRTALEPVHPGEIPFEEFMKPMGVSKEDGDERRWGRA